jgi:DNA-binding LacI/PurR family transcriptional regulator
MMRKSSNISTIKDVAEKAGVSSTTVSHVVNKTRFVSADLIQRVIDVPGQLSLVGFDDIAMASRVIPKLTTFAPPKRELGEPGSKLLLLLIWMVVGNNATVILESPLVVRESSVPPVSL